MPLRSIQGKVPTARRMIPARIHTVAPLAYQVILEPSIGQFRDFESPRVHELTCGKRESVS